MTRGKGLPVFIAIGVSLAGGHSLFGDQLQQAKVTQVINDVKLMPSQAAPRPATVNDLVKQGTAVRTGADSRTELTFADLTITRLGANTVFSFKPATRDLNLLSGAVLIQVPPGAPEVRVLSSAVSAAISGGTAIFDATTGKFMVLEGVGRVWPTGHPELAVTVHAGEMVWLTPDGHISQPEPFDVNLVMETSLLITDFARLPNYDLIAQVIDEQQLNAGTKFPSPPYESNEDIISQRAAASPTPTPTPHESPTATPSATPSPSPSGTPDKFGSPQTITSPNPYVINATTRITTDPSITTNGQTDFGTIYRGPSMDGPFSGFAFGSTSSFDTASGFDAQITGSGAGFRFTALTLTGNPTVDTTNGETSLGLIGVNAITSGAPGGTLTFTGIKGFLLATVDGPITLGQEVSFSGMNDFTAYARGAGNDLTLGSNVNATSNLRVYGQRDINVTGSVRAPLLSFVAGRDLNFSNLASSETITGDFGNVTLQAGNNITSQQQIQLERLNASGSSQFNLTLNAGNDLTVGTNLLLSIANSEATFGGSANIVAAAGGTLTTGGILDAVINNGNGGNLGANALIQVAASNLNTGGFGLTIDNSLNGRIQGDATILLNVPGPGNSGNVNIPGDAILQILNRGDDNGLNGGLISGSAAISLTAETFVANSLTVVIDSSQGGGIDGDATISSNIGTLTTARNATFEISYTPAVGRAAKVAAASDPAIDFNGGTYNVVGDPMTETAGNFRSTINGIDGTITFSAATVHADFVKVGSFGDNGVLKIGGGLLDGVVLLKLYAPGSNGVIDFIANVTLNSEEVGPIIAATTVRIENGVMVTITGGGGQASVYTDNAKYSVASGGDGSTTGMFGGNGAASPAPLASAPPFDDTSAKSAKASRGGSALPAKSFADAGNRPQDGNANRKKFMATADHGNIRSGARDDGAEPRGEVRVADTNQLIQLMANPALAMMEKRRNSAEIKRGVLGHGKNHSSGSARGSPPGPNQLRDPRGQMARP